MPENAKPPAKLVDFYYGSSAIGISRSQTNNAEINFIFDEEQYGKIGENQYLIVWMDLTNVEFRKASFGVLTSGTAASPYRTDDKDKAYPAFYYLADGSQEWTTLNHGGDGCFGAGDNCAMLGKKGYFAFNLSDMQNGSNKLSADSLITGIYIYLDIQNNNYANVEFYIDDIKLVADYTSIN